MRIVAILTMLMIAVAAHEYGHYRVMIGNGVEVSEFAVGMGPVLWQKRLATGTMFQLRALPLGGFVKPVEGSMEAVSPWANFKIAMAGMVANSIVAFFLLLFCYLLGLKQPDFLVKRKRFAFLGGRLTAPIAALIMSFGLWLAMPVLVVRLVVKSGWRGFFRNVAGPIGILAGQPEPTDGDGDRDDAEPSLKDALLHLVAYLAMLNAAIAGFNLLPLLPLDGGVAFSAAVRGVFGPASTGFLNWYGIISFAAFMLLVIAIFASDIIKVVKSFRRRR